MQFSRNADQATPVNSRFIAREAKQDVTDAEELLSSPAVAEGDAEAEDNQRRGLFLGAKPFAPVTDEKTSLRTRFLRKFQDAAVAAEDLQPDRNTAEPILPARAKWLSRQKPGTAAAFEQPAVTKPDSLKAKFSWPKKANSASANDAAETAPTDTRPIGPTESVKKAIVVRKKVAEKRKSSGMLPIRVLIGFLPEVTERDARDFALGVAERNCDQISIVRFDAFRLNNGFAYEIQEGGTGRAYLPEIIKHFQAMGPFEKTADTSNVFIRTATRITQVDRTRDGLQSFLLPESSTESGTDWLEGTTKMAPAIPTMFGVLAFGAVLFTTGFFALTLALYARIQPYETALIPAVERATDAYSASPLSRWALVQSIGAGEYVKAIRYANGKWEVERGGVSEPTAAAKATLPLPATASSAAAAAASTSSD